MRIFISIKLPENIINKIISIQENLKALNIIKANFINKNNLHITIAFIGTISQENLKNIINILENIKSNSFIAILNNLELKLNRSKILWLNINSCDLYKLAAEIRLLLKDYIKLDHDFNAHITIARIKDVCDINKLDEFINFINTNQENLSWQVNKFYLENSQLSTNGSVYNIIKKFTLS